MISTVTLAAELGLTHEQVITAAEQTGLVFPSAATGEIVDDAPVLELGPYVEPVVRQRLVHWAQAREVYPCTPDNFRHDSFEIKD